MVRSRLQNKNEKSDWNFKEMEIGNWKEVRHDDKKASLEKIGKRKHKRVNRTR